MSAETLSRLPGISRFCGKKKGWSIVQKGAVYGTLLFALALFSGITQTRWNIETKIGLSLAAIAFLALICTKTKGLSIEEQSGVCGLVIVAMSAITGITQTRWSKGTKIGISLAVIAVFALIFVGGYCIKRILSSLGCLKSPDVEISEDAAELQSLTRQSAGDGEAMPKDIMKLKKQLKDRYRKIFGQVKTSPVNFKSRTWLQDIYVSLILKLELEEDKEEPIDYDGLFKFIETDTPEGFVTRLALTGEAGVGKTTLFAKIALDWSEGKIPQEINLLFLESFREIKEGRFFGDTVMGHFPDESEIKGERVDEYIRKNQRKVLILLDGLDETKIEIKKRNQNDAIVSIVRGERFIYTPVIITTRPFGADQIKSNMEINDHYKFGKIKGFTKENMAIYINKFFRDDSQSASTLIDFIDSNQVVSEYMAPFPIFCSMLCTLWKTPSEREYIQTMETFSQLLKRLVFSLKEQYSSKLKELGEGYKSRMKKAEESMKKIGGIAFKGVIHNQYIFDEKAFISCTEAATIACEVGILSLEMRPAPLRIRESQQEQFIQEFSFPHKLLQEYIASFYLASLFLKNRQEFNEWLTFFLLVYNKYKKFRYVLYFTAANGGKVGKSVLEFLCENEYDMEFIIEVAFECHDSEAIDPVRNLLERTKVLQLDHPIAAHVFTLESIGKEVVLGASESFEANASSLYKAAVGLFTLQSLQCLTIATSPLDDEFYTGMSAAASQSKIGNLMYYNADLGSAASSHYARGLCSMPNLQLLSLIRVNLSDEFYSTMASEASKSKIEKLAHHSADLGPAASSHYARGLCLMSNLRSLTLNDVELSDGFYLTMASEASNSKIQMLSMRDVSITLCRLHSILSLPHLRSLTLRDIRPVDMDETLTGPKSSVDELTVDGKHVTSLWNLGLHASCPRVKTLNLNWLEDEHVPSDIVKIACSPFHHLTHIYIGGRWFAASPTTMDDPQPFCEAVKTSCPLLTKLSITRIGVNNEKATEIIQLMKTHPHLTSIELKLCDTNKDLDPLVSKMNSEGKVTVTVEHDDSKQIGEIHDEWDQNQITLE